MRYYPYFGLLIYIKIGGDIMMMKSMTDVETNIYRNLKLQVNAVFRHSHECSYKTRERYKDAMLSFSKFLAIEYRKQNVTKIKNEHIQKYVLHMQKEGYSTSYVTTNLSAIRYFYDKISKGKFIIKSNRELGVDARKHDERIGPDRSISKIELNNLLVKATEIDRKDFVFAIKICENFGLRIHEVYSMRHSQIRDALKSETLKVKGKGGLIRYIPIKDNKILLNEIDAYKRTGTDRIFVSKDEKTHLKIKEMQEFVNSSRKKNENYTFHSIRHYYAQDLYKYLRSNGMTDFEARMIVANRLGHNRVEVSSIYLDIND